MDLVALHYVDLQQIFKIQNEGMMEEDFESQENELLALEAIYEKRQFVRSTEEPGGEINIYLDVPSPFLVLLPSRKPSSINEGEPGSGVLKREAAADARAARLTEIAVDYLPPIVLNFKFPEFYPSREPPAFTLSCKWLTNKQVKC